MSGPAAVDEERFEAAARNLAWEKGKAKGRVRLLRARGSTELGKVASGSAKQGLWLGDRKVKSQVSGEDQSRLPGRGTAGEVKIGERKRARDRTKRE